MEDLKAKGINVLSLFDGISCGRVALERAEIKVNKYYASEIDKYAIQVTQKNYPDTIQIGDVTQIDFTQFVGKIDLLIGGSPCFTADALVMTDKGLKNIDEIKVGDLVLTHKSRFRKVLNIGSKLVDKTYTIKAMGLPELTTTEEHPFYSRTMFRKWNNNKRTYERGFLEPQWIKTKDLNKNTYLGTTYNTEKLKKEIYRANDTNFWYFVGRFTADGWIVKTKRLHRKNSYMYKVILCCGKHEYQECKNILDKLNYNYSVCEERTVYKFCISNQNLLEYLELINRGAKNKIIHPDIWHLPIESKKAFLEGYFSGDGHLETRGVFKATTISKRLAYGLKMLISEVYKQPTKLYFRKVKECQKIENRIVHQNDQYIVAYKPNKCKQDKGFFEDNYSWYPIKHIDVQDGMQIVYNLEVEEDNSYTANTIVVHNCTNLSIAGDRKGLEGEQSKLFYKYLEALQTIKPKYFLLENVASMTKENKDKISELMGCEPICINSALLSAQQRKRLYWTNIPNIEQPEDKDIVLKDILESVSTNSQNLSIKYGLKGYCDINGKSKTLTATAYKGYGNDGVTLVAIPSAMRTRKDETGSYKRLEVKQDNKANSLTSVQTDSMVCEPIRIGQYGKGGQGQRIYSVKGKSVSLSANGGGQGAKTGLYKIDLPDGDYIVRKLTPIECERLQTLSDNYTAEGYDFEKDKIIKISNTQRYKQLGNGWTVDVIAHIFKNIK